MSRFYLSASSSAASTVSEPDPNDSDPDTLPYPTPLPRSAFLTADFSPSAYLSTLHNRHQTLEDLRTELRERSQLLSRELLDLVNANYQDFLSLGSSLKGGDEKVEEVRLGLLGFRKDVEGVRDKVEERAKEVDALVQQRIEIRKQIALGRQLLDFDARIGELEGRLMVDSAGKTGLEDSLDESSDDEPSEEEGEEEDGAFVPLRRLEQHVQQYLFIRQLRDRIGLEHPFLVAQQPRLMRARNTLLLDLSAALKLAKGAGSSGRNRLLKIIGIYRDMEEGREAVKVLKELSRR